MVKPFGTIFGKTVPSRDKLRRSRFAWIWNYAIELARIVLMRAAHQQLFPHECMMEASSGSRLNLGLENADTTTSFPNHVLCALICALMLLPSNSSDSKNVKRCSTKMGQS